jgi:hypothetical protein
MGGRYPDRTWHEKTGMAFAWTSATRCHRTPGGERRLGGKPGQGRQPPEAGAVGPPLQGLPPSHTRPPRLTAGSRSSASSPSSVGILTADNAGGAPQRRTPAGARNRDAVKQPHWPKSLTSERQTTIIQHYVCENRDWRQANLDKGARFRVMHCKDISQKMIQDRQKRSLTYC